MDKTGKPLEWTHLGVQPETRDTVNDLKRQLSVQLGRPVPTNEVISMATELLREAIRHGRPGQPAQDG